MSQEAEHNASNTPLTVFLMFLEMLTSMCMQEVVHLGIADLLRDGPRSVGALAQEVGVQDDSLLLLLLVLCSREVFVETEMGVFAHTEKSRYLQSDTVGSMVGIGEMFRSDWFRKIWTPEGLTYALQTGKTAFEHVFGESFWAYATKYPTAYSTFSRGMTSSSASQSEGLAQALDVTGLHSLVDVGGGEGSFLSTLLLRHPEMKGILFDTPPVNDPTRKRGGLSSVSTLFPLSSLHCSSRRQGIEAMVLVGS